MLFLALVIQIPARLISAPAGVLCLAWSGGCIEGVLEGVWERHDVGRIFLRFDFSEFWVGSFPAKLGRARVNGLVIQKNKTVMLPTLYMAEPRIFPLPLGGSCFTKAQKSIRA